MSCVFRNGWPHRRMIVRSKVVCFGFGTCCKRIDGSRILRMQVEKFLGQRLARIIGQFLTWKRKHKTIDQNPKTDEKGDQAEADKREQILISQANQKRNQRRPQANRGNNDTSAYAP